MKVFTDNTKVPIKSWCMNPEEGALAQARNLANLPFVYKWVALAPDAHAGYGMPIGGICLMKGVVSPNCTGSDIGCGMCSITTNIKKWDREILTEIMKEVRYGIPVGFGRHKEPKAVEKLPEATNTSSFCESLFEASLYQIGSLGGCNHFWELQKNEDGYLCVMIHSGSRNLGKQIADYHNKIAVALNEKYFSAVPTEWDLAFLPVDSSEGQAYINDMRYCVNYALANRTEMMNVTRQAFYKVFKAHDMKVEFSNEINIAHNYAVMEHHYGEDVIVHRKGATSARLGETGIIPGSQGTKSYIVEGLGNKESFESCSHGAGRRMGRKEAQRTLNLQDEIKALDDKGIIHSVRVTENLDEAPSAYKDIDVVMEEQRDLVKIVHTLTPLAVIKG